MDPNLHSEVVRLRNQNFAAARERLSSAGVPVDEFESRGTTFAAASYLGVFSEVLELPLWPFSRKRIVNMLRDPKAKPKMRRFLNQLLYRDWCASPAGLDLTEAERLARGRPELVEDAVAHGLAEHLTARDGDDLLGLLRDRSLGPRRVFFVGAVRRVFKDKAKVVLDECLRDPDLAVEASHQIKMMQRKDGRGW